MTIDTVEEIQNTKPLHYEYTGLTDDLRMRAKTELHENEDNIKQCLHMLKDMLKEEPDLDYPNDDDFMLLYLRARKFDVKRAFQQYKNFFTTRRKYHEVFDNFDFSTVQKVMDKNFTGFLPYRDPEGSAILVIQCGVWNPYEVTMTEVMRTLTSGLLHALQRPATQIAGFKVIVDFKGFGIKHMTNLPTSYLWLFAEALQNCFPGRFRAVHVVNEGPFWTYVWAVLKQLLTKKLRERFQFHGKNMKKLHKYLPPNVLPEEYGGELGPFDISQWAESMKGFEDYLVSLYKYGYKKKNKSTEN